MHPNPIKAREGIQELREEWQFSFDDKHWQTIHVPYCPESSLSGVGYTDFISVCYYKTVFTAAKKDEGRIFLHFGAVDYRAEVYLNGAYIGSHVGGYTPFSFDITDKLCAGENELYLKVFDSEQTAHAHGKQSYKRQSFGCFYTRTTGIWQSVWLEYTPKTYIKNFYFYPNVEKTTVGVELLVEGVGEYKIEVFFDGRPVGIAAATAKYRAYSEIELSEKHLWALGEGNLYEVKITYGADVVSSYFGLRSVEYKNAKFCLNGEPVFQKLVLDQGYYPDGIYTAPGDEALQRDIRLALDLGFNGSRLHQKVFDPKFLYYCDKAGYMVWGEYPSWGIDYSELKGLGQFLAEWEEALSRDFNHPSIVTWCPLNEVWGAWYDARKKPDIRFVDTVYSFTKRFDPTRPCVDVSGGYHGEQTDLFDFHCYEAPEKIKAYLDALESEDRLEVPLLYANESSRRYKKGEAVNLSEYGGIAFSPLLDADQQTKETSEEAIDKETAWGYGKGENDGDKFVARYKALTELIFRYDKISGYCYTQLYDVEQEQNGFYTYDRSDKLTPQQKAEIKRIQSQKR